MQAAKSRWSVQALPPVASGRAVQGDPVGHHVWRNTNCVYCPCSVDWRSVADRSWKSHGFVTGVADDVTHDVADDSCKSVAAIRGCDDVGLLVEFG